MTPMLRPVNVANAAPVTPRRGKGPKPKIRQGSSTRLMMFDTQSSRMAMAASPAPRKIALFRNSISTAPQPPSIVSTDSYNFRGRAHQPQQQRCVEQARNTHEARQHQSNSNRLNGRDGSSVLIFLANAAGHHRRRREAQSQSNGEHQRQQRFCKAYPSDGIGTEMADPKDIHHGKK